MFMLNQTYSKNFVEISCNTKDDLNKYDYAFYVYLNGNVIEKKMYTLNNKHVIDTSNINGVLKTRCFFRNLLTKNIVFFDTDNIRVDRNNVDLNELNLNSDLDLDVIVDNQNFPIKYIKKDKSKKLYVFLNGAVSLQTQEKYYPYFSRNSWADKFNGDCLYLYDVSLDLVDKYTLGWYRGTTENQLHFKYIKLIERIMHQLNLKPKDIVFYGSSGGGFAALKFSEDVLGSTAVAINPQYKILDYSIHSAVDKFKSVFDIIKASDAIEVDVSKFKKNLSRMIIVQNIKDKDHYHDHFLKLWKEISDNQFGWDSDINNYALLYDHESGHAGEPEDVFQEIMKFI